LAAREIPLTLPERFELRVRLQFSEPENHVEFKLIDPRGNTFMKKWYRFGSVGLWQDLVIDQAELIRMWGPDTNVDLKELKTIEFGVSGADYAGTILLSGMEIIPLPPDTPGRKTNTPDRGYTPRWLLDQQAYWTLVGIKHDDQEALICEDGSIEPLKRGPSVLPVVSLHDALITRNNVTIRQELLDDCLPLPSVIWEHELFSLRIDLFAQGEPGNASAYAQYTLTNKSNQPIDGKLFLLVEPYQIYPPWQGGGGFSPIRCMTFSNGTLAVNGTNLLISTPPPDTFCFNNENGDIGGIVRAAANSNSNAMPEFKEPEGFAAGALIFHFALKPDASTNTYITFPLHQAATPEVLNPDSPATTYARLRSQMADQWSREIRRVGLSVPEPGLAEAFFAGIAYNLITQNGPALQPGSRSYNKSWMRDGAIAAVALLEAGHTQAARDFIEWYAPYQLDSGEIPPIIDSKAEDPLWEEKEKGLVEYDSQGEFIWLVMQYYRFTKDRSFLQTIFPHVLKALHFLENLRAQRLTEEYRDELSEKNLYYGLLPESTSHEGYYMKHSFWDDFWGIKGWEDGMEMAAILNRDDLLDWMKRERDDFKTCVLASIQHLGEARHIDYMPGCVELADLDPTSTAAAIIYCDLLHDLPPDKLNATYDRLFDDISNRLKPGATYRFTPYEMRNIGALLRMGRKNEALTLLRFQLKHMRPAAWRHFAEVAHSDERYPCYIGDMPHTWVCAEYMHGIRNLFLYEENEKLILGAGIDPAWLTENQTVAFEDFPTWYGTLSGKWQKSSNGVLHIEFNGDARPPKGFVLMHPDFPPDGALTINGKTPETNPSERITFDTLPAEIILTPTAE
ncbi:MAG: hypothetical protein PHG65_05225, partial [Kiritimatiellae bacterium]|nr:hypothetical protein [Kiritimatiellia bacterium]